MSKQGSTLAGLLDAFAISTSISFQYGVPLKFLAKKFAYSRYEPAGYTDNSDVQVATSITDYIFRYLALRFLSAEDLEEVGISAPVKELAAETKIKDAGVFEEQKTVPIRAASYAPGGNGRVIYADSVCRACGGMLIQTGTCKTCIQCGTSNGGC